MLDNTDDNIKELSVNISKLIDKGFLEALNYHLREYFARHDIHNPPLRLYEVFLPKIEYVIIRATLDFTGGKKSLTSAILGINRNTLRRKMKDLKIQ